MSATITAHDPSRPDVITQALSLLRPHLPVSLPLYRRLQFGCFTSSSVLLTTLSSLADDPTPHEDHNTKDPYVLAFTDRSVRPETELWLFASWETSPPQSTTQSIPPTHTALLTALFQHIATITVPTPHTSSSTSLLKEEADAAGISRSSYASHAQNPQILLAGAVHETTTRILVTDRPDGGAGLTSPDISAAAVPNHAFVWDVASLSRNWDERMLGGDGLPAGLRWDVLREREEFEMVLSRTVIPRQIHTLMRLTNVGVYEAGEAGGKGKLVAWAFAGMDGSLTSLHVEPEWRNRGLAKAVTVKLFQDGMENFWEEGVPRWGYGFVVYGNESSRRMCAGLGGKADWSCTWVRVDLGRVNEKVLKEH